MRPIVWTLAAICLLLGILLGYSLWKQAASLEKVPVSNGTNPNETTLQGKEPQNMPTDSGDGWLEVATPYGVLRYPDQWKTYLRVYPSAEVGYSVLFSCRLSAGVELPLFDISFGEIKGNLVGYIQEESGKVVPVYLQTYFLPFEELLASGDRDIYLAMQEELNQVLEQLRFMEDAPAKTDGQHLQTQHKENGEEYTVEFFCVLGSNDVRKLFAVICNDNPDGAVGAMKESGKMVHVSMEDPELDGLSQKQQNLVLAMMEAINDLLDALGR